MAKPPGPTVEARAGTSAAAMRVGSVLTGCPTGGSGAGREAIKGVVRLIRTLFYRAHSGRGGGSDQALFLGF